MKRAGRSLVGPAVEGMPWLGTFHAIAAKMLRRHAELAGLQSNYTIIDTDDQLRLLKQVIQAEGLDEKRWPPSSWPACIDRWKNKGLTPADLWMQAKANAYANGQGQKFYRLYQDRLKALNACDFGDLLLHMLTILRSTATCWSSISSASNYSGGRISGHQQVQYLWLRLLAQAPQEHLRGG
jgi:DNA helicase-2/ATP-dependent DNA helicase PcrA